MNWLIRGATRARVAIKHLADRYLINSRERSYLSTVKDQLKERSGKGPVLMVQCPEDYFYLALFGWIVIELRRRGPLQVEQWVPRSLRAGSSQSAYKFVKAQLFQNVLTDRKWLRLFGSYCDRVAYRSAAWSSLADETRDFLNAWRLWRRTNSNEALLSVTVREVPVGDLIYDSYLRFKPAETMRLRDFYLLMVIWQALRDLRRAEIYFAKTPPKVLLTSYSTYIQHGIPVRVALRNGVRVFSLGNYQEPCKELTLDDWMHTRNPDRYREIFSSLDNVEERIAEANAKLGARIAGGADTATAYMRRSAYVESNDPMPDVRNGVVIFLHDFFDSPHCYRWMAFSDFWEWTITTLNVARKAGLRIFVKPHPNQIVASERAVARLKRLYPEAAFLSAAISNKQLVDAGIALAVTVYGTVAHEMAYLGVPSIGAGHHPHVSFDFCRTAKTREEYERLLQEFAQTPFSKQELRRQSLEFYYMHNLHFPPEIIRLSEQLVHFRSRITQEGNAFPPEKEFCRISSAVIQGPGFAQLTETLAQILRVVHPLG